MKDYWKIRATKYKNLAWVNNKYLLTQLLEFSDLCKGQFILDAGCGNGVICNAIDKKYGKNVIMTIYI